MTLTVNVRNAAAWASSTVYATGARRTNGGNAYICTTGGTSAGSGGPSGTGSGIVDNTCVWAWSSAVDYTSIDAAIAGVGVLTQPTVIQLWNDAEYLYSTSGTTQFSGNSPTVTNTLTMRPAPGEGFYENPNAATNALTYNVANGVGIRVTTNYRGFNVGEANVTLYGLQMSRLTGGPNIGAASGGLANLVLDRLLVKLHASSALVTLSNSVNCKVRNCAVEYSTGSGNCGTVNDAYVNVAAVVSNCTFVVTGATPTTNSTQFSRLIVKNVAMYGRTNGFVTTSSQGVTACYTDAPSPPTGWTTLSDKATCFVGGANGSYNLKLSDTSPLLGLGTANATDGAFDILGTARPQNSLWDVGAYEMIRASGTAISIDYAAPFEFLASPFRNDNSPVEWIAPTVRDIVAQAEILAARVNDQAAPVDWLATARRGGEFPLSLVASVARDGTLPASWQAIAQRDAALAMEALAAAQRDASAPMEWGGALAVTLDSVLPIAFAASPYRDASAPVGALASVSVATPLPMALRQGVARDGGSQVAWRGSLAVDGAFPLDRLLLLLRNAAVAVEALLNAQLAAAVDLEVNAGAARDASFLVEWLQPISSVDVDIGLPIDWRQAVERDGTIPIEWRLRHRSLAGRTLVMLVDNRVIAVLPDTRTLTAEDEL